MKRLGMLSLVCVGMVHVVYGMDIQEDDSFGLPPAYDCAYPGVAAHTPPATPSRSSTPPVTPPEAELPFYDSIVCPPLYTPSVATSPRSASQARARLPEYTPVAEIVLPAAEYQSLSFADRARRFFSKVSNVVRPQQSVVVGLDPSTVHAVSESMTLFNVQYSDLMHMINSVRNASDRTSVEYQQQLLRLQRAANLAQKIEDTMDDLQAVKYLVANLSLYPENSQKLQQFGKLTVGHIAVILERDVQQDQETKKLKDIQPSSVAELLRLICEASVLYTPTITSASSMNDIFFKETIRGISSDDMKPAVIALQRIGSSSYGSLQKLVTAALQGNRIGIEPSTATLLQTYNTLLGNPEDGRPKIQKFIDSYNALIAGSTAYAHRVSKISNNKVVKV